MITKATLYSMYNIYNCSPCATMHSLLPFILFTYVPTSHIEVTLTSKWQLSAVSQAHQRSWINSSPHSGCLDKERPSRKEKQIWHKLHSWKNSLEVFMNTQCSKAPVTMLCLIQYHRVRFVLEMVQLPNHFWSYRQDMSIIIQVICYCTSPSMSLPLLTGMRKDIFMSLPLLTCIELVCL